MQRFAAKAGYAPSLVAEARALLKRKDDPAAYKQAVVLLTKACEANNDRALRLLAECLFEGKGVEQDCGRGLQLLTRAALLGNDKAQYTLGKCHLFGKHGEVVSYTEARRWLHIAARDKGEKHAMYLLGYMYERGLGFPMAMPDKAFQCYSDAAAANVPGAIAAVARCHEVGDCGAPM